MGQARPGAESSAMLPPGRDLIQGERIMDSLVTVRLDGRPQYGAPWVKRAVPKSRTIGGAVN